MSCELISGKQPNSEDVTTFIHRWNITYPIDRWWRGKHGVAFNSPVHRVVSFLDMYTEWLEDAVFNNALAQAVKNTVYKPGDWLMQTEEDVDTEREIKEFESMDFTKLDDPHHAG